MRPRDRIQSALERSTSDEAPRPAIVAFVTAGYPRPADFLPVLRSIAQVADAIEIGVPFSDPMADGVTIQRSSQRAIEHGVTLKWIFDQLATPGFEVQAPLLLMTYLNPLLAFGFEALAQRAAETRVAGFIVPDLPYEESTPLRDALGRHGLALVQLVTPATPAERLDSLCAASEGFVYAVMRTGITGAASGLPTELVAYLDTVKRVSKLPVCAGFGIRNAEQVALVGRHVDGVVVGSALVEALERGEDPGLFLNALRAS